MHILIVHHSKIPVMKYGGTERVVWYLGKALVKMGHKVTYLVMPGSACDFANVLFLQNNTHISTQIPNDVDVVHFHFTPEQLHDIKKPYVITIHGNNNDHTFFDTNTIFVSQNHAMRYGSTCYVHNGIDWSSYPPPTFSTSKKYFHFLGDAGWRVKNLKGAIKIIHITKYEKLAVMGGDRFNFKQGIRLTLSPRISFWGMVGGDIKYRILQHSKGMIFPVLWHEPFGLAIIESLYFGCPVFGTPYGSLSEIVTKEVGFLSNKSHELASAILHYTQYSSKYCHDYALFHFNADNMAQKYIEKYELVLKNKKLNDTPPQLVKIQNSKFLDWE
ncbi:MAG: glycosyltransferase [Cytophagales bacterium]|nr:glycosyltransferase [Cytophagales bacterium]